MGVTRLFQLCEFAFKAGELRRGVGQFTKAPAQVAVDAMLADTLAHERHRFDTGLLQIAYAVGTDVPGETADVMTDPANQLATVAPAGAPADPPGFQQDHREPALGQFDGGVDAGEAAANHTDISDQVPGQLGPGRHAPGRGGVVGERVFLGVLVHWLDFTLLQERVIRRMIDCGGVVEMYSLSSTAWEG